MIITTCSELTIDGRLTLGPGQSSKALFDFYGPELQSWFHAERAAHDVIMVGAGTVRTDNPELTVRHAPGRNPLRVVPTTTGRIPPGSHILNDGQPTLFAVPANLHPDARKALQTHDRIEVLDCGDQTVDLRTLVDTLAARGHQSLMIEGGAHLLHGFFAAGLVDRIIIKHIPVISGSVTAPGFLAASDGAAPAPLSLWQVTDWRMIGGVGVAIYQPKDQHA